VCWDHQTASLLSNIVVVVDFESGMLKQPFFKPGNTCCSAVSEAGNRQLRVTWLILQSAKRSLPRRDKHKYTCSNGNLRCSFF
jgi:hypothetical protein